MEHKYYMFHKPSGCITARTDQMHRTVMEYFSEVMEPSLHPVGRLDKDTEGLLLITTDGELNQKLMHPANHVSKTYEFYALGKLTREKQEQMMAGLLLKGEDKPTKPCRVKITRETVLDELEDIFPRAENPKLWKNQAGQPVCAGRIEITEGRKHQIKRMLKECGCYCIYLKRTAIGTLSLDNALVPGAYRELTQEEIQSLCSGLEARNGQKQYSYKNKTDDYGNKPTAVK